MPKKTCKRRASGKWFNCFSNTGAVKTPSPTTRRRSPRRRSPRRSPRRRSPRRSPRRKSPRRSPRRRSPRTRKASPGTVSRRQNNLHSRQRNLRLLEALNSKMGKIKDPNEKEKLRKLKTILLQRVKDARDQYR